MNIWIEQCQGLQFKIHWSEQNLRIFWASLLHVTNYFVVLISVDGALLSALCSFWTALWKKHGAFLALATGALSNVMRSHAQNIWGRQNCCFERLKITLLLGNRENMWVVAFTLLYQNNRYLRVSLWALARNGRKIRRRKASMRAVVKAKPMMCRLSTFWGKRVNSSHLQFWTVQTVWFGAVHAQQLNWLHACASSHKTWGDFWSVRETRSKSNTFENCFTKLAPWIRATSLDSTTCRSPYTSQLR